MTLLVCICFSISPGTDFFAKSADDSAITIRLGLGADGKKTFDLCGLKPGVLSALADAKMTSEEWTKLFSVHVKSKASDTPAIIGTYRLEKDFVRFEPQFPLTTGITYRAIFHPNRLPGRANANDQSVVKEFDIPKLARKATTVVTNVYPSGEVLPENQLRFYIHFSTPMRQGAAYRHIRLMDSDGKAIDQAFLELEQELWDRDGKRLTLLLNPGRIKKGLEPRDQLGPVLIEGNRYALEIGREWLDATGATLTAPFRKTFTAGRAEEDRPDPKSWKLQAPAAGTMEPITVRFPRPLDHALLHRLVWIVDSKGNRVDGHINVRDAETVWSFRPLAKWPLGVFRLVADTRLEDRAGNSIARPFEVDVLHPVENEIKSETVYVPFELK